MTAGLLKLAEGVRLAEGEGFVGPRNSLKVMLSHYGVRSCIEAIAAQEIEQFHSKNLEILTVGSPTSPVRRTAEGGFQQPYTFGSIIRPAGVGTFPDVGDRFHVTVTLAGVRCFGTDDPGVILFDPDATDEPFLIASVFTIDPREKDKSSKTTLIDPDRGVGKGDVFGQNSDLAVDIAVPGDSDIALNVQLFDRELITDPEKARNAISDAHTAGHVAAVSALTAIIPPAGLIAGAVLAVAQATGLLKTFSDGIGSLITSLFSDDHLGTMDLRITNDFLRKLRDDPKSLDRTSNAIGGETYNFPQLPEDDSEAGKSWMFRREGKGTYRPFFRVVLTEP